MNSFFSSRQNCYMVNISWVNQKYGTKFQPRYSYELYSYKKKSVCVWGGGWTIGQKNKKAIWSYRVQPSRVRHHSPVTYNGVGGGAKCEIWAHRCKNQIIKKNSSSPSAKLNPREKSESRPSAKLNPREISKFRGWGNTQNVIPAKFNHIKVI